MPLCVRSKTHATAALGALPSDRGVHRWFDGLVDAPFPELVRDRLLPIPERHGFEVTSEDTWSVEMVSPRLRARAVFDPRGELDVEVFPIGSESWEGWAYIGMIGRASLDRLLELVGDQLQSDPRILEGDLDVLARYSAERRQRRPHLP